MKRLILFLFACLVMIVAFSCADDKLVVKPDANDDTELPEPEKDPDATIKLAQSTLSIGGTINNFNEVTVQGNQRTFAATIQSTAEGWLKVEFEGVILRATALTSNNIGAVRDAIVTVIAGMGENTASTTLTITQQMWNGEEEDATLTLNPTSVRLDSGVDQFATVTMTSNKDVFQATVQEGITWLKAEVDAGVLTVTTLEANTAESSRNCTVAVVAGVSKTATEILTVTQEGVATLPSGTEIGALYEGGVVVFKDETVIKVMSVMASEKIAWAVAGAKFLGLPNTNSDGFANTTIIKAQSDYPDNFPAAKFCTDMGAEWFLPSRGEYAYVANNYVAINAVIEKYPNGVMLTSDYIWSSNEDPAGAKAFAYRFTDKGSAAYTKSGARLVRCMKNVAVK